MRTLLIAIATLISAATFALSAAHATPRWTCEGAEYICGPSKPVTSSRSYDATERKAPRATKQAKASRSDETASLSSDDESPRRRTKQRAERSEPSSGGSTLSGAASYYWQPQKLASGGWFNPNAYTAAHKTLPFGTRVRVTNQRNGQSVDVVINDRGPYIAGRIIDLSSAAAGAINMKNSGVVPVTVTVLGRG